MNEQGPVTNKTTNAERTHHAASEQALEEIERILALVQPESHRLAEALKRQVLATPDLADTILEGESIDVVGPADDFLFAADRGIVHYCGLRHITVNAIVLSPSYKEAWLQRRAHHKKQFPLNLTIAGGHVRAMSTPETAIQAELAEELGLRRPLKGRLTGVCRHEWHKPGDRNVESRYLYMYGLTQEEHAGVSALAHKLSEKMKGGTEVQFKAYLELQKQQAQGAGEVWGMYAVPFGDLFSLSSASSGSMRVTDVFATGHSHVVAPFTPDLLADIVQTPWIVSAIQSRIMQINHKSQLPVEGA